MADTPTELKGMRDIYATGSTGNALSFMIKRMIGQINTAMPVIVLSAAPGGSGSPAGRVSVKALVNQRDGFNNALSMAEMFDLPYFRYQGGKAAVICDPVPGDIGLAVFSQRDSSNVQPGMTDSAQAGSFRSHDMADGFYLGGFLNQAPTIWLELAQDGTATIHAPAKLRIESPLVEIAGQMIMTGEQGSGAVTTGGLTNTGGTVSSNGKVLDTHTHPGDSGGTTGPPN